MIPSTFIVYLTYIIGCFEECLKYVLLLNFDEEPKYDYLIEELKKAYIFCVQESGEKLSPSAFKQPIFDWSVSLATRFYKMQTKIEDHWNEGEANILSQNLSQLNHTLMKSRLNLFGSKSFSSRDESQLGSNYMSPMSSNEYGANLFSK